jgi:hypothetical protein
MTNPVRVCILPTPVGSLYTAPDQLLAVYSENDGQDVSGDEQLDKAGVATLPIRALRA